MLRELASIDIGQPLAARQPDRASLRYPAEHVAAVFLSLMFARVRKPETGPSTEDMIDMLLHGSINTGRDA